VTLRAESVPIGPMTFEEFLAFEEAADYKHELVDGYVYPWGNFDPATGLAGTTRTHNRIEHRLHTTLDGAARRAGCEVFGSDMKLRVSDRVSYYPDLQIVCDPTDQHELYTERPCAVIEILSQSTARIDLIEKMTAYQRVGSLQAYFVVYQHERRIRNYSREADGRWRDEALTSGTVRVPCIEFELSLEALYAGILG
jgi:Uma2 family endonuclease